MRFLRPYIATIFSIQLVDNDNYLQFINVDITDDSNLSIGGIVKFNFKISASAAFYSLVSSHYYIAFDKGYFI